MGCTFEAMSEQYFGPSLADWANDVISRTKAQSATDPEMERLLDEAFPERKQSQ